MFFILAARRTKRVISCLAKAAVRGLASAGSVLASAALVLKLTYGLDEVPVGKGLVFFAAVFFFSFIAFFALEIRSYGLRIFHKYDENIIGDAFTGVDRDSRMFEAGVHTFMSGDFRGALEYFTDLDADNDGLSDEEQGVLSFYRGRCYQIMNLFPNAAANYENAVKHGFRLPELPLFMSRCYFETGDVRKAVSLMKEIMDTDHQYSSRARYEIGNICLRNNDRESALKWFSEAIEKHECYAESLGGAAVCYTLDRDFTKSEEYYQKALLNDIENPGAFMNYYKKVQAAVVLGRKPDLKTGE